MLFLGGAGAAALAEEALDRIVAQGQLELGDPAAGAKAGGLLAPGDDLGFEVRGGLAGPGLGGAGLAAQARRPEGLVAAKPLADGVAAAAEVAGGGLDRVGAGVGDELVAEGDMGIVSAKHGVAGLRCGRRNRGRIQHALV